VKKNLNLGNLSRATFGFVARFSDFQPIPIGTQHHAQRDRGEKGSGEVRSSERAGAQKQSNEIKMIVFVSLATFARSASAFSRFEDSDVTRGANTPSRDPTPTPIDSPFNDLHSPGIDVLHNSALTSALPLVESNDAREERDDGDEAAVPAPGPPEAPKTLGRTLSSDLRPSTRPNDVAGEGRDFSAASG